MKIPLWLKCQTFLSNKIKLQLLKKILFVNNLVGYDRQAPMMQETFSNWNFPIKSVAFKSRVAANTGRDVKSVKDYGDARSL